MFAFAVSLICFALEGAVCVIMAIPIAWPIAALGASVAYMIQRSSHITTSASVLLLSLFLPLFMGAEWASLPEAPIFPLTTSVEVNAPPEIVSLDELVAESDAIWLGDASGFGDDHFDLIAPGLAKGNEIGAASALEMRQHATGVQSRNEMGLG